jgi:hypothetical protein
MNLKDKICESCQEEFTPLSGAQKLCESCRKVADYERKHGTAQADITEETVPDDEDLDEVHTGATNVDPTPRPPVRIVPPPPEGLGTNSASWETYIAAVKPDQSALTEIFLAASRLVNLCTERGCAVDVDMLVDGIKVSLKKGS